MRRCVLKGPFESVEQVYADLARQLGLAAHFGANLDALWDALLRDVPGPIEIVWRDFDKDKASLGAAADRIRATLEEAAAERRDLHVKLA
jgi:ribonuclease inhibitor